MNILIIGLGYAGIRFLEAFKSIDSSSIRGGMCVAYVGKRKTQIDIQFYADIASALAEMKPEVVVVSVTDGAHAEVLHQLEGYSGFVICEKPLVNSSDDLNLISSSLKHISGFCMNLVERYSDTTEYLKHHVEKQKLKLIRANFTWGKDRINDRRPTCGVPSEIVHALDLIHWIASPQERLILQGAIGSVSDFSVSGDTVMDSVAVTALLGSSVVTGYSSFVNIVRQRTIDFIFASPDRTLIYAHMVFDTPSWDCDHLRIWERTNGDDRVIAEFTTEFSGTNPNLHTIQKLRRLVQDVVNFVVSSALPTRPFADLPLSITLQNLLNQIECTTQTVGPAKYVLGEDRHFFNDEGNLERLG